MGKTERVSQPYVPASPEARPVERAYEVSRGSYPRSTLKALGAPARGGFSGMMGALGNGPQARRLVLPAAGGT